MKNRYKDAGSFPKLAGLVNSGFGTSYTGKQVKDWFYRQGIKPSPGRGRGRGAVAPVGAEWIDPDGYIWVKVSDTGTQYQKWKQKHRMVWEAVNGKIPEGRYIIFLDGNRRNCALENLAIASQAENLRLLSCGLRFTDPEFTKTGLAIVRHRAAVAGLEKKQKEMKERL